MRVFGIDGRSRSSSNYNLILMNSTTLRSSKKKKIVYIPDALGSLWFVVGAFESHQALLKRRKQEIRGWSFMRFKRVYSVLQVFSSSSSSSCRVAPTMWVFQFSLVGAPRETR